MAGIKKKIDDWMVRVTFAEADADESGHAITGEPLERKTKLALDRVRFVRDERAASQAAQGGPMDSAQDTTGQRDLTPLSVMVLDDEPIVGKRLQPVLERIYAQATEALPASYVGVSGRIEDPGRYPLEEGQ